MSRRRLVAVMGALLLTLGVAAPTQAATVHHFTVVERATTDTVIDNGDSVDSIGDLLAWGNKLYGPMNNHKVGRDEGWCIRTNPGFSWECSWTNLLRHGSITVQGPFRDDGSDTWLSVTGGTGSYANIRGQMRLHWRDALGTEFDFEFWVRY